MPPRHGKSELCSKYFPAWYLGRHPNHNIILASYSSTFADQWGEGARDVIAEYGPDIFGVGVHQKRKASGNWQIAGHVGRMRCAGVQSSGVTGRGAHLLIIDDPIKDAEEARSQAYRDRAWNWYTATARTRLEPNGIIVVIMTRWHEDDLCGRLRENAKRGGEQWESLTLPALATEHDAIGRVPGEALWPWRFDEAALATIRDLQPEHWWNALYQQRPTPAGGAMAKEIWFPIIEAMPSQGVRRVRFWDCAGGTGDTSDWTVGALVARKGDTYYIEDIKRVRYTSGDVEELIVQTAHADGIGVQIREEQEGGSAGLAVINSRRKRLAGYDYRGQKPLGKPKGWIPMLIQAEAGNMRMLRGAWNSQYLAEISAAPHGRHDDQLDAVSGGFHHLALGGGVEEVEFEMG